MRLALPCAIGVLAASALVASACARGSADTGTSDDTAAADGGDGAIDDGGPIGSEGGSPEAAVEAATFAPTRPIGANLPGIFLQYLGVAPSGPAAADSALDDAKAAGVTHVRFIASGYYPNEMTQGNGWVANPQAYLKAFDTLVDHAAARGLRLVPSLLWNTFLFADIAGEPLGQLFTPGSKTRKLAEAYISAIVSRYASSDAILFWELGNEMNLSADIDLSQCDVCNGATNGCGGLNPPGGTPCKRTSADNYYSCDACRKASGPQEDLAAFTAAIAGLVRGLDPKHPFSSGNGYPRPSAWHLAASPCPACDWTLDSADDYAKALLQLHPAGVDVVSVHHYAGGDSARFGSGDETGGALLEATQRIASGANKKLYVGEFGEPRAGSVTCNGQVEACGGEATAARTRFILDHLLANKVPYSAIWSIDFFPFCANVPSCFTVTAGDPIVGALGVHDVAAGACAGAPDGGPCGVGACASGACVPFAGQSATFDAAGDESAWTFWTNCTGCTDGTHARVTSGGGGYLSLASHDLPCTGSCQYAGAYALGPTFPLTGDHVLARFRARTTSAGALVRVIPFDGAGGELAHTVLSVAQGPAFATGAVYVAKPAGAVTARVRLELPTASATLDLDELAIVTEP